MQDPTLTHDGRRHQHRDAAKRGCPRTLEPPITLCPGQVIFRMLCHVNTVGGVKGNSGSIIKQLERETGARIQVEPTIPSCLERVINIIGYAAVERKIVLEGENGYTEQSEVSQAQEALLRVFERVWEVEGTGDAVSGCRLLPAIGQIGPVRGENILENIRRSTGAMIRMLPADQLPTCASASDELIQIMGTVSALKKALLAVSHHLQVHPPIERASVDIPSYAFPNSHSEFLPNHSPLSPLLPGSSAGFAIDHSLSADVDRNLSLDEESTKQEVVFRLLCSTSAVGGVIGKGATIVRALEKETGASIKMAAPVAGSKERVASVSAMENAKTVNSPAQIAIVRVFARSIEVGIDRGHIAGLIDGQIVTARLLVESNQVGCLIDGGRLSSDISSVSGVDVQILEGDLVPKCGGYNDKVIQIVGEYESVKNALFQVTGRLRDNLFHSMALGGAGARKYSYSAIPDISPYGSGSEVATLGLDHSSGISLCDQETTETWGMDHAGLVKNLGCPISPGQQSSQRTNIGNLTDLTDGGGRGLTTFGDILDHKSIDTAILKNRTMEVVVPEHALGSIYGENGSNLNRLKQISGAKVIVQDPCPGENEGKVILSGTPDQIQKMAAAEAFTSSYLLGSTGSDQNCWSSANRHGGGGGGGEEVLEEQYERYDPVIAL